MRHEVIDLMDGNEPVPFTFTDEEPTLDDYLHHLQFFLEHPEVPQRTKDWIIWNLDQLSRDGGRHDQ